MGTGDIPGGATQKTNALVVIGDFKSNSTTPAQWVSWPNAGLAPAPVVYPRWSLSHPGVTFGGTTVTMTNTTTNANIPNNIIHRYTGGGSAGDPTIVWEPDWSGHGGSPPLDTPIQVTLNGISGSKSSHAFTVTVINPDDLGESVTISGTAAPPTSGSTYSFTPVTQAAAYELSVARTGTPAWPEGAEDSTASQVNEQVTFSPLRSTAIKRSGSKAFHLAIPDFFGFESFELDRTLLVGASSQLRFHQRMRWATVGTRLSAQVSTDGGSSWSSIWNRTGNHSGGNASSNLWDSSWNSVTQSLGSLAGQLIRIRFCIEHESGSLFPGTEKNLGFYIDDIEVTNSLQLEAATVTALASAATGFTLNATTAGGALLEGQDYYLQVRPRVGIKWFGFGPPLVVTPSPASGFATWISSNFPAVTGGAADDHDGDGLSNAMEYAFGLNPTDPSDPGNLPPVTRSGSTLTANFNEPANISGITYRLQSSTDLSAGSWTNIADLGAGTSHRFSVTGGSKLFVRYQIEVNE